MKHLLLVDDCPNISLMLQVIVKRFFACDVQLTVTHRLEDGLAALSQHTPHAILLDYGLPPYNDCGAPIKALRDAGFHGPIHLWSNHDERTVTSHPAAQDVAAFYRKQDFIGMRLRDLVRDYVCPSAEQAIRMNGAA